MDSGPRRRRSGVGAAAKAQDEAWPGGQMGVHVLLSFGRGCSFLAF